MRIELAFVSPRQKLKSAPAQELLDDFVARSIRYEPVQATAYPSEAALLAACARYSGRAPAVLIQLDSHGTVLTSEQIAAKLGQLRDSGIQQLVCAIGPPHGWSRLADQPSPLRWSLGAITLPHELALVVLAEQIYRACTILAGHPYHGGHT